MKNKDYPDWNHESKKSWLRQVRKQWSDFRRKINHSDYNCGSAYYPEEVYEWIKKFQSDFEKMDKIMRDYYKNA